MIKSFSELNNYPEYPESETIEEFVSFVIKNKRDANLKLEQLEELSDKQYHTYQKPSIILKNQLEKYIEDNWINDNIFLEVIMSISTGFSLNKKILEKALKQYSGDNKIKNEFLDVYKNSEGKYIDPWHDLRNLKRVNTSSKYKC